MSETLWAAVIGGAIGGIIAIAATIPPLIYRHYHWKKDKKLEHLRAERRHREEQYLHVLTKLPDFVKGEGDWDWDTVTRILLVLPDDISREISAVLKPIQNKNVTKEEVKKLYSPIARIMRKSLAENDEKINKLMS